MKVLSLVLGFLLGVVLPANAQLIPYTSTSPLYSQPSTADPGELRLPEAAANGTNYTAIKAPASIAADVTFTWPGALPTSTGCFSSDTQGVLSIIACNFNLADAHDWTGATTFTSSSGLQLKPYGTSAGNTTELRLLELAANGTNYVGFKAPDSLAANTIWTLPSADASGCVKSNGSGTLSIASCATDITGLAYITVANDATLTAERALTAGAGISLTDAGANSTLTVTNTGVISVSCTTLTCSGTNPASFSIGSGVLTNAMLANSSITIQGAAVSLGGSTLATTATPQFAALGLGGAAGATDLKLYGATSGSTVLKASAVAGATTVTLPATTGTVITTGDSATVTNAMLAGSIAASKLVGTDIATVGTITAGVWQGTAVADGFLASALTGKTYESSSQAAFVGKPFGAAAGNTAEHRFLELAANGTNYVGFKAPDALAANVIWVLPTADSSGTQCLSSNGSLVLSWSACSGGGSFANPTASVGLTAVNGVATTGMRSDAAPALSQAIAPTWTGQHTWTAAGTGPKIRLTDIDSQLFLGGTTDPGWTVPAVFTAGASRMFIGTIGGQALFMTSGVYYDGTERYVTTGESVSQWQLSSALYLRQAAAGTAGNAITWAAIDVEGGTKDAMCYDNVSFQVLRNSAATCTASTARAKTWITTLTPAEVRTILTALRPVSYTETVGLRLFGLVAEEVALIEPRLVGYDHEGRAAAVRYESIVALLVAAWQDSKGLSRGAALVPTQPDPLKDDDPLVLATKKGRL